jgi:acyl carrier protein
MAKDQTDIIQQVSELAAEQVAVPPETVTMDSSFKGDLGFDSLDQVEFVMAVEERFDIEVTDEAAERIETVRQAVDEVERTLAGR